MGILKGTTKKKAVKKEPEEKVVAYKAVHKDIPKVTITSVTSSRQDVTVNYSDGTKDVYKIQWVGSSAYIGKL